MKKYSLTLYFVFYFSLLSGQIKKFNNSVVKGKALTCPSYLDKYPCYDSSCRKIGKWIYFYKNGNTERIENYKKISDCSTNEIPDGLWQYFNEQGLLVKQDEYKNGKLWTSDIAKYFCNDKLSGEILVRKGIQDTIEYIHSDSSNLIKNGDFHFYFGPSQLVIGDGQNEIGKQIPFWSSCIKNTPDYYNQFRGLKNVPDNLRHSYNEKYDYVGIIMYHNPSGHYSEYITGNIFPNLKQKNKYCLKIRIRLSQNAGFYIDKFGAYFSDSINIVDEASPQILFNQTLDNRDEWRTLCAIYIADGTEKYITLGRFANLSETSVNKIRPLNQSEGDYNESAYYIIDNVELLKDTAQCNCKNGGINEKPTDRIDFDLINPIDSTECDKIYVLKNIFFEFDRSELLPSSFSELKKLLLFLNTNEEVNIIISGHTDNIGLDEYNRTLSLSRARSVSDWLIKSGINPNRLMIEGHGSDIPILENSTEENRAINRRVEFKIIKR